MATQFGMTRLGYHVRPASGDAVTEVVEELLAAAHVAATALLAEHGEFLAAVAGALLDEETLTAGDIRAIAERCGVTGHATVTVPPLPRSARPAA
jgi:ATP-dependent Zn protease